MTCQSGDTAYIWVNSTEQIISSNCPVDYSIDLIYPDPPTYPGSFYDVYFRAKVFRPDFDVWSYSPNPPDVAIVQVEGQVIKRIISRYPNASEIFQIGTYKNGIEYWVGGTSIYGNSPAWDFFEIHLLNDPSPLVPPPIYRLTVTDTTGQIFQKDYLEEPEVVIYCTEQCPPKTVCAIDCDSHICCYDENGKVLDIIYKKE